MSRFIRYQAAFDRAAASGVHPIIISAAEAISNPVLAGVFEHRPGPIPLTWFGLTSGADTDPNTIQLAGRVERGAAPSGRGRHRVHRRVR